MKAKKVEAPARFILTNRGLMKCTVAEFDPSTYKGLKQNCGRKPKDGPFVKRKRNSVATKPTNVGDPNKKR